MNLNREPWREERKEVSFSREQHKYGKPNPTHQDLKNKRSIQSTKINVEKGKNGMNFELTHQRRVAGRLCSKKRKHEIDDEMRNF